MQVGRLGKTPEVLPLEPRLCRLADSIFIVIKCPIVVRSGSLPPPKDLSGCSPNSRTRRDRGEGVSLVREPLVPSSEIIPSRLSETFIGVGRLCIIVDWRLQ